MPAIKKQTEPIVSAWIFHNRQMNLSSSATNYAAIADFLLPKEKI
jgi:hypothetical protein